MPFYIRKSLKAGPFRFNLSKSGIGVSAGVPGFRVGTGPRGNYVHMGRNGLYYRSTLSNSNSIPHITPTRSTPNTPQNQSIEMKQIESVDVLQLSDTSSSDLLKEINDKSEKTAFIPFVIAIFVVLLLTYFIFNIPTWVYIVFIIIFTPLAYFTHLQDQARKTVVLFYELDEQVENAYQRLHDTFQELQGCSQVWHIPAKGDIHNIHEQKRQAGAGSLLQRSSIRLQKTAPKIISTNISVPSIPVGRRSLYFFPDRILIHDKSRFGAISYSNVQVQLDNTRFIESSGVPRDARIIGQTWQYVNQNGSPDKRFKNNRQIPIASYSSLHFTSTSGINELLLLSKPETGSSFIDALKELASIIDETRKISVKPRV